MVIFNEYPPQEGYFSTGRSYFWSISFHALRFFVLKIPAF